MIPTPLLYWSAALPVRSPSNLNSGSSVAALTMCTAGCQGPKSWSLGKRRCLLVRSYSSRPDASDAVSTVRGAEPLSKVSKYLW